MTMYILQAFLQFALFATAVPAWAGGSHYTVKPCARVPFAGRVD
jgi:hypothetical protein